MTPPEGFVKDLKNWDPNLRIRWGNHTQCWYIERKLDDRNRQLFAEKPNPFKSRKGLDLYEGWKEGYVHVLTVHPTLLENRDLVWSHLREADTWRQGGMAAFNRVVDEALEKQEKDDDREIHNYQEAAAKEFYDVLAWKEGRRVAVSTPPEPEYVDTGLGFKVVDRRRVNNGGVQDAGGTEDSGT